MIFCFNLKDTLLPFSDSKIKPFEGKGYRLADEGPSVSNDENDELQKALQLSLLAETNHKEENGEDAELRKAIELSLRSSSHHSSGWNKTLLKIIQIVNTNVFFSLVF